MKVPVEHNSLFFSKGMNTKKEAQIFGKIRVELVVNVDVAYVGENVKILNKIKRQIA